MAIERKEPKDQNVKRGNAPDELSKSDVQKPAEEDKEPEFYVWLNNGDVQRVAESDLPTASGTNAVNGHWLKDGKQYLIVAVYAVEENVGKEKTDNE